MIGAALKLTDGSADQYVLLRIARDIAAGAGDAPTALRAVEKMVERFDVPAAKLTAETLQTAALKATTSSQQKAVAQAVISVANAVADEDEYDLALSLCESARSCAQKARQLSLGKELSAKIGDLKKRQLAFREYRDALAALEKNPTDPGVNLVAGRRVCFVNGDWERGLPMLALGSDAELKTMATKDLGGAKSAEEQAALGDAWWALAEGKVAAEGDALRLRAGFWYRQAEPKLVGGLAGLKVKQRLEELSKLGGKLPAPSKTSPLAIARSKTAASTPEVGGAQNTSPRGAPDLPDNANVFAKRFSVIAVDNHEGDTGRFSTKNVYAFVSPRAFSLRDTAILYQAHGAAGPDTNGTISVSLDGETWLPIGGWTEREMKAAVARQNWHRVDFSKLEKKVRANQILIQFQYTSGGQRFDIKRALWVYEAN
jgi:hypothetical protein